MKLVDIIEKLDIIGIEGSADRQINGISYNSNLVKKDYIFVAIEGLKVDGHQYISEAISRGASVLVVSLCQVLHKKIFDLLALITSSS